MQKYGEAAPLAAALVGTGAVVGYGIDAMDLGRCLKALRKRVAASAAAAQAVQPSQQAVRRVGSNARLTGPVPHLSQAVCEAPGAGSTAGVPLGGGAESCTLWCVQSGHPCPPSRGPSLPC